MKRILLATFSIATLSACGSMIDHQTQIVTMRTPGAQNARCIIENQDMKYVAYTDQTIEIMKSPNDLVIHCLAAGNREQTVHVKREINDWVFLNVANGFVPGAAYDYFSRGAFDYPDVFTVSFVGDPVKPYPLPEYHNEDLRHNNEYGTIEYMGPGVKLSEETRYEQPAELKKKENLYHSPFGAPASSGGGLDDIHRQYNPHVSSYAPAEEDE